MERKDIGREDISVLVAIYDDAVELLHLQEHLTQYGVAAKNIEVADGQAQIVDALALRNYHLVIAETTPSGIVLDTIASVAPWRNIPLVVAVTTYGMEDDFWFRGSCVPDRRDICDYIFQREGPGSFYVDGGIEEVLDEVIQEASKVLTFTHTS